ncbi:MAG: DUF302 domain-containing protein [Rhodobacter sp.]|nr:DUF302 domain-containing protein [Rhodobacter sp.]
MKLLAATAFFLSAAVSPASADMIRIQSAFGVDETIDRLEAAVEKAGAKVFARIDHAAGAESVGMELAAATALIFGNPKLGTPALQAGASIGLDLPLRVLAYQDGDEVWVVYHDPKDVAEMHGIPQDLPVFAAMTGALAKLTGAATTQ